MRTLLLSFTLALGAFCAPLSVQAENPQDWVPAEIELPSDMEVIVDRSIGSSTRIFSFSTSEDVTALIEAWSGALRDAGYTIVAPVEALDVDQVEFSGYGIGNAKISVQPSADTTRDIVQFDASLSR